MKTIIIAEAGVNHNGDIKIAKKLIEVAARSGADYVKFQTFTADKLVSPTAEKAGYQLSNTGNEDSRQYKMLNSLELSLEEHFVLIDYAKKCGIKFLSTAYDTDGLIFLHNLGLEVIKSPSGEITNLPYLRTLGRIGKPVFLSTGMATFSEVEEALNVLVRNGLSKEKVTILHCNTEYPTPYADVNLTAMLTLKSNLGVSIGYSDHTPGIEVAIAAVSLGAAVIEKHFTLDKSMEGPDHLASLEPEELKNLCTSIRNVELVLSGDGVKYPSNSEIKNIPIVRKSIHLSRDLPGGTILEAKDLIPLRPGDGLSPMLWDEVIGKKTKNKFKRFKKLDWSDLE